MAAGPRSLPAGQQRGGHRRPGPGSARLAGRHSVAGTSGCGSIRRGRPRTYSAPRAPITSPQFQRLKAAEHLTGPAAARSRAVIALGSRCELDPPDGAAERSSAWLPVPRPNVRYVLRCAALRTVAGRADRVRIGRARPRAVAGSVEDRHGRDRTCWRADTPYREAAGRPWPRRWAGWPRWPSRRGPAR